LAEPTFVGRVDLKWLQGPAANDSKRYRDGVGPHQGPAPIPRRVRWPKDWNRSFPTLYGFYVNLRRFRNPLFQASSNTYDADRRGTPRRSTRRCAVGTASSEHVTVRALLLRRESLAER